MTVTAKLIKGADGAFYVVEGNPEQGYDLFLCVLAFGGHFKRSWQAVHEAMGENEE